MILFFILLPIPIIKYNILTYFYDQDFINLIKINKQHYDFLYGLYQFKTGITRAIFDELSRLIAKSTYLKFPKIEYFQLLENNDLQTLPTLEGLNFPFFLTKISIEGYFDAKLKPNILPKHLKSLFFTKSTSYMKKLQLNVLPNSLETLLLPTQYKYKLEIGVLPCSLTNLEFGKCYNHKLESGILPPSLLHLKFGEFYDHKLESGILPPSLTYLKFGDNYNQKLEVGVLPCSLTNLKFGIWYNKEFTIGVLPPFLLHLKFGNQYNQPFKSDILPRSLLSLIFGLTYNQKLERDVLPHSLMELKFGAFYDQNIDEHILPSSLKHLHFSLHVGISITTLRSLSLESLTLGKSSFLQDHFKNDLTNFFQMMDKFYYDTQVSFSVFQTRYILSHKYNLHLIESRKEELYVNGLREIDELLKKKFPLSLKSFNLGAGYKSIYDNILPLSKVKVHIMI